MISQQESCYFSRYDPHGPRAGSGKVKDRLIALPSAKGDFLKTIIKENERPAEILKILQPKAIS